MALIEYMAEQVKIIQIHLELWKIKIRSKWKLVNPLMSTTRNASHFLLSF